MSSSWRKLAVKQSALPSLLFQFSWSHAGYTLYVSDLTSVWCEKLSYQDILKRADETSPTIDPSEDKEQFDLLFSKVEEALRGGTTALNSGSEVDSLQLTTTSKLPAPLRPLQWQIYLQKQSPSSLTDQLLLPLLKDEAGWESRQKVLLEKLKEKDWVLAKMYDKLESLGVEMGKVFPAAAGVRITKKGSTRAEVAKAIKGLVPFDESEWLASSSSSSESTGLAAEVLRELFGSESSHSLEKFQAPQDSWWTELQSSQNAPASQSKDQTPPRDVSPEEEPTVATQHDMDLDQDGVSTASSDEFELQDTPPRLRAQRKQSPKSPISPPKTKANQLPKQAPKPAPKPQPDPPLDAGESTASDSDSEPEAPAPRQRTPTPPKADPIPDPVSPEAKSPVPQPAEPSPQTKPAEPESPPKKKKGGLGVIGGKKKKEKSPSPPPPEPTERKPSEDAPITPPKPKRTAKLGMIGGKKKAPAPAPAPAPASSPPPVSKEDTHMTDAAEEVKQEEPAKEPKKEPSPDPEETEEQKAVRRREELKRQLAEKSKAPKKKRRL